VLPGALWLLGGLAVAGAVVSPLGWCGSWEQDAMSRGILVEQVGLQYADGQAGGAGDGGQLPDPVFVLCMGRSGSTLLRLILDTHPELACPPETNIAALCSQLAVVWSLIEGAPLALHRGDEPPVIPDAAIAGIRQTMDLMTGPYLGRRGKRLYCDKSLGTARYAELLMRIYPGARFICLFRHPMDVISSGLEACPWGLNGYGFDAYIAGSPGNAVMALARYWHDQAHEIAAVQEKYPGACHRVRYEDMVADPERVAAGIFEFIGVQPVPGIAQAVFTGDHERFGPADHKIWHTSVISPGSVGRGDSVPAGMIPPPVLESINQLLDDLGYIPVDENWGTADMPASMLAAAVGDGNMAGQEARLPEAAVLSDRLATGLARADRAFAEQWRERLAETFTVVMRQPNGQGSQSWYVDLSSGTLADDGEEAHWAIVGTAQGWREVLAGRLNLSVALRRNDLRYCDFGENDVYDSQARIALLADLLDLPSWAVNPAQGAALAG
jgi:Sulfotransferase family